MKAKEILSGLKFVSAKATRRIYIGNYYEMGARVVVSAIPGTPDLFIVGMKDLYTYRDKEWCQSHLKADRDRTGKPVRAFGNIPAVKESDFLYKAQIFFPCPDGCCGMDSPIEEVGFEEEKDALQAIVSYKKANQGRRYKYFITRMCDRREV